MPSLYLTVLTNRNETWRLWKRISKFNNSNFLPVILIRLSILFLNYISRDLDITKYLYTSVFFWYLIINMHV